MEQEKVSLIKNSWILLIKAILFLFYGFQLTTGFFEFIPVTKATTGGFFLLLGGLTLLFAMSNARIVRFWFWIMESLSHIVFGIILVLAGPRLTAPDYALIAAIWAYVLASIIYLSRREKERFMVKRPVRLIFSVISIVAGILILINNKLEFARFNLLFGLFFIVINLYYVFNFIKLIRYHK